MDTTVMRIELHDYINHANEKELELIYTMWLNNLLDKYEWWKDEELVAELDRRSAALKKKDIVWEDLREELLSRIK